MSGDPFNTETQQLSPSSTLNPGLIFVILLGLLGVSLLCIFGFLLLRQPDQSAVINPTSVSPQISQQQNFPAEQVVLEAFANDDTVSMTADSPVNLQVNNVLFAVQGSPANEDGSWQPVFSEERGASWLYGTVINYVFSISATNENRNALEALIPGDEIEVVTRSGKQYRFFFTSRESLPRDSADVFAQRVPGITLLLVDEDNVSERLVIRGRYDVSEVPVASDNTIVSLGQPHDFGDVRVTPLGNSYLYDRPEARAGFAFFLVDFQVENTGTEPFDTSTLEIVLGDELGNQYAQNSTAGAVGNAPSLQGVLEVGSAIRATSGFEIPLGLQSAFLQWVVKNEASNSTVQVNLPFEETVSVPISSLVELQSADISDDGSTLNLRGLVTNNGPAALTIDQTNINLEGYAILSVGQGLPWTIQPGQTIDFAIAFERPIDGTAVFSLLNQPFELTGLR